MRLHDLENCETCEVTLSQPLSRNETVLFIYENIPSYDSWSGNKNISVRDILSLFKLFRINEILWEDYFQRILFFHNEYILARQDINDKETKREDARRKAKEMADANRRQSGRKK